MSDLQQPVQHAPFVPSSVARAGNGLAVTALVLGIVGFLLTPIPFFIGLFLGGVPSILAVIFGISGIVRGRRVAAGVGVAVAGLVLGGLAVISVFFGAGIIW